MCQELWCTGLGDEARRWRRGSKRIRLKWRCSIHSSVSAWDKSGCSEQKTVEGRSVMHLHCALLKSASVLIGTESVESQERSNVLVSNAVYFHKTVHIVNIQL